MNGDEGGYHGEGSVLGEEDGKMKC